MGNIINTLIFGPAANGYPQNIYFWMGMIINYRIWVVPHSQTPMAHDAWAILYCHHCHGTSFPRRYWCYKVIGRRPQLIGKWQTWMPHVRTHDTRVECLNSPALGTWDVPKVCNKSLKLRRKWHISWHRTFRWNPNRLTNHHQNGYVLLVTIPSLPSSNGCSLLYHLPIWLWSLPSGKLT